MPDLQSVSRTINFLGAKKLTNFESLHIHISALNRVTTKCLKQG